MELLMFSGCEDEVEFEVEEGSERLVVEAWIMRYSWPEIETLYNRVRITKSIGPMSDESDISGVKGATVILKDINNVVDTFSYDKMGYYVSQVQLEYGVTYSLTIITEEGEEYRSASQKMPKPSYVDSIYVLDKSEIPEAALSPDGQYVVVDHEVQEGHNFYRWEVSRRRGSKRSTRIILEDDKVFSGDYVERRFLASAVDEVNNMSVEQGDTLAISREAITEDAYRYLNQRLNQQRYIGQPFQTPPAPLERNIYNVNNPDEVVLGFFSLSTTSNYLYVVE